MVFFKNRCLALLAAMLLVLPCSGAGASDTFAINDEGPITPARPAMTAHDRAVSDEDPRRAIQDYLANLSFYEPTYFLPGTDLSKSKFQLSFKYRLFGPDKPLTRNHPWISGLHLGYTQTSLWDLESSSKPFVDTSYKPEIFFLSDNIQARPSWLNAWVIQAGLKHESNGHSGIESRSTNYTYLKTGFVFDLAGDYRMGISPQVWMFHNNDDRTNPDLEDYRGFFEIETGVSKLESFALISTFRHGSAGPTVHVDFSYPLSRLFADNIDFYLYTQYFSGYAETLKNYRQKYEAIRIGIAITR
ncbi:phospholipase A [Desulfosudis oleivorans]|uniref:Phosphatidylcholine 1-acylhydrolase n=1 Tax=Desulfosudis oleivorans (strain DSM 6200 / JCM 39069 / Hxd3) TaxID=96561 RepID=A8ZYH5_DESOH|nr:phospholipase A [Desulfosudis oleivorans]ABW68700.1 outer membrane phospholipase A [Desulfosudis oleivorans Hxd3]